MNSKIIIRLNTTSKKYINGYFSELFYRFFYNLADEIVVNSIFFKKELKGNLKLNSTLIYNLYKPNFIKKKLDYFKNYKGLKIINIGRLTGSKRSNNIIKKFELINEKQN